MKNNARLIVVIISLLVLILGAGYFYQRNRLNSAVSDLEIYFDNVDVKSFRLLPSPEANLTLIYVANNTKDIAFTITLDNGELYYGKNFLTPLTISETQIKADGLSTFQVDITITGSILDTIDPEEKSEYILQGELVASSQFLGVVPVTTTKPVSELAPSQN